MDTRFYATAGRWPNEDEISDALKAKTETEENLIGYNFWGQKTWMLGLNVTCANPVILVIGEEQ